MPEKELHMELLITIIVLALIFDYINGFHDAANAIATIVSTKVLTPLQAVIWAAFFNFLAFSSLNTLSVISALPTLCQKQSMSNTLLCQSSCLE